MELSEFWTICSANGVVLSLEQLEQFKRYNNELIYWNEKVNLISKNDTEHIFDYHFLHSLSVLKYIDLPRKSKCLDLGTGGGFPGIPIAIANPEIEMILVDSVKKKINITNIFALHTNLKYLKTLNARAEDLSKEKKYNQYFDFIFARSVGKISQLISWSLPLIKQKGKIILFKGGDLEQEISEANKFFPEFEIKEQLIKLIGVDRFELDEKKIIICSFKEKKLILKK
jgi:16S rRNA (guanine527-N7)-methyltransferase